MNGRSTAGSLVAGQDATLILRRLHTRGEPRDAFRWAYAVSMWRVARLILLAVAITGCGVTASAAPEECGFNDGAALAFAGDTSLRALGIDPFDDRVGEVVVTAAVIDPPRAPSGGVMRGGPARFVCIVWPDGVGIQAVPDDWEPPN